MAFSQIMTFHELLFFKIVMSHIFNVLLHILSWSPYYEHVSYDPVFWYDLHNVCISTCLSV